jgi:hypothetical protein
MRTEEQDGLIGTLDIKDIKGKKQDGMTEYWIYRYKGQMNRMGCWNTEYTGYKVQMNRMG